jgi:hypothetical protein
MRIGFVELGDEKDEVMKGREKDKKKRRTPGGH